jgi:hypothetical protein
MVRRIDELIRNESRVRQSLDAITTRLTDLEHRMAPLEAGQCQIIAEARGAAAATASEAAARVVTDLALRLGSLDERMRRLPPPA